MKILIIQTAFIGDVVLATPLIENFKAEYPGCKIDFLLRKGNESVLQGHPHLEKLWIFDKSQKISEISRLLKAFRAQSYDYIINAQRFFTSGLFTCLSGAKTTIGFDKNPLAFGFSYQVKHRITQDQSLHEVDRNLRLIEDLVPVKKRKPRLYPREKDYRIVPKVQAYICMAPASIWFTKQWPKEKWIELIHQIPKKYKIYLIGSPADVDLCQDIQQQTNPAQVTMMAGKLSILESVALIQHARMTFTNDSAPLHFASAVNAPVAALYCSTIPAFGFGPLSDESYIVETKLDLDCRPCGLHGKRACPEGHFKCSEIRVEDILHKVKLL